MHKVLVVDDDAGIRELTAGVLRDDYLITEASGGEEALDLLESEPFDVVLLDVNMPDTNGWEALRTIKDPDNGWPDTKVIMLTCHAEPERVLKSWVLGADNYLVKPCEHDTLLEIVAATINS